VSKLDEIKNYCDAIEEWYEFMLAYAAQGITDDRESQYGSQLRELFEKAVHAAASLPGAYSGLVVEVQPDTKQKYQNFLEVLKADTTKALAAMELVLAQPRISSQLVDNLNASLHVRTLLTDVFLLDEIVAV
jgi:hypothetical protein